MSLFGNDDNEEEEERHVETPDEDPRDTEEARDFLSRYTRRNIAEVYSEGPADVFVFHVFRNRNGEVKSWALMWSARVNGENARVPVVHAGETKLWYEYSTDVFDYTHKEQVVPSQGFYKYIYDVFQVSKEFNDTVDEVESDVVLTKPNFPQVPRNLPGYERETLGFFKENIENHRKMTDGMEALILEAQRSIRDSEQEETQENEG